MDLKQVIMLAFQASILCTVFGFGLRTTPATFLYLIHRPGLAIRSLIAVLVIMPAVAIGLTRTFEFRNVAEIALMAIAISPVPPLLPKKGAKAQGHESYGLALMVTLAVLAILTVPLSIEILERLLGRSLDAPSTVANIVLKAVVLPIAAGLLVRAVLPALANRIERPVAKIATVLLPLAVLALLAGFWQAIWAATGQGAVLAMVVFVAIGLLVGHLMGGPDSEHAAVLSLSCACRHPGIALSIASASFPDEHVAGTVLLYLIVNTVVVMPYLMWRSHHASR